MAQKHPHGDTQSHSQLEKEFELERMILFSDAVFAIAITLMVIEIKWPEIPDNLKGVDLYRLFRPTILQFIVFVLSFFYIGRAWSQHLRLFRLLRTYDQGLINRNLRFLFFVVTFPFTAAGLFGHIKTGFIFPLNLYMFNVAAVAIAHFQICRYMFRKKPGLSIRGEAAEEKYIYMRAQYSAVAVSALFLLLVLVPIVFPDKPGYIGYAALLIPLVVSYSNKKTRKYKPTTTAS
jgi:uncharacterized membrane protein